MEQIFLELKKMISIDCFLCGKPITLDFNSSEELENHDTKFSIVRTCKKCHEDGYLPAEEAVTIALFLRRQGKEKRGET